MLFVEDILNRRWQLRGNFQKQVAIILRTVRMSQWEVENLQLLFNDIKSSFKSIWPGSVVKPFGSIVTGLALKTSDVDCYLDHCDPDPETCVKKCGELIDKGLSPFQNASVVIKKIPIVQFFHPSTGRRCDLSFSKPIAVRFGELVGYLLSLDERALQLAVLVKYWAKVHKVTGPKRFPSNALVILIIFFLQLKKILPPVATLQRGVSPHMVDGWNTAFRNVPYKSNNREGVYDLLGNFFACYSYFDFRGLIVCPYLGQPLERDEFSDVTVVPSAFQLYKENLAARSCEMIWLNCIMCIQDPFDHARNCAGPVKPQVAGDIIMRFKTADYIYKGTPKNDVLNKLLSKHSENEEAASSEPQNPSFRNKRSRKSSFGRLQYAPRSQHSRRTSERP